MAHIINSLLDLDFYKFTMGQLVFLKYRDVDVKYAFKNRTKKIALAEFIKEEDLRQELDHIRTLKFDNTELHYLRGTNEYGARMFGEEYLEFLKKLRLPSYSLAYKDGQIILECEGKWAEAIYWETMILAVINELYYRALMERLSDFHKEVIYAQGKIRLAEKIKILKENPEIKFADFGHRRRFSRDWQDFVIGVLKKELPDQFLGTSDTHFALKHGLMPIGTAAHEMFMILAGIMAKSREMLRQSHNQVLCDWWDLYGWGLSIALTDTFGTDFFFQDMTKEQAKDWKGLRQDSGDPFLFGEKAIAFYQMHGIDPKDKVIIFSDGLDLPAILKLQAYFRGRIKVSFGWGTNLTNDLGLDALSIVMKPIMADGHGVVKLSDNIAKAMGTPEDIKLYKEVFNYEGNFFQECRY